MSDKNKPQDDLSIEEILGSIRRIIAEDEDETVATEDSAMTTEETEDEEPLELTHKIEPDGTIVDTTEEIPEEITMDTPIDLQPVAEMRDQPPETHPSDAAPEEVAEIGFVDHEPDETEIENPVETPSDEKIILVEEPKPMALQDDDSMTPDTLLSSSTAEATSAVMAKLARHTALMEEGSLGGATIESMVREILKPMLKSWLDENLAGIVQKMVEREIERLTKHL